MFVAISEYKSERVNAICQLHYRLANSTMSIKLQILFVACIIVSLALGRPDITDTKLNPLEDTGLNVNGTSGREKRDSCGWTYGCHKGHCWSNCKGGLGVLSK